MQYQLEDLARRVQVIEEAQPSSLMTNVFGLRTDGRSAAVSNDILHQFKNGTAIRVQAPDDGHVNAFTAALSLALGGSAISVTPGDSHGRYELEITGGGGRILDGEARRLGEACGVKILGFSMPVTGAK